MTNLVPMGAPELPMLDGAPPAITVPTVRLSRQAKAAVVVRLLLNEGADIPLEDLPEDLQAHLTKAMGQMRMIDNDTLSAIVSEFVEEVERVGLSFPGGMAGALTALDGKISARTADRLRKEAGVRQSGDPWQRVQELPVEDLIPILDAEATEVAAVMLSKLPVKKAADLLGKLPGPRARQITYAVSQTGAVTPEAVDRIGLSLAMQIDARPVPAFEANPVERVGAILNSSTSGTRDDMLAGLEESDQGFATAVRKAIFTFGNIPERIAPRDVPRIVREIDQDRLLLALAGAEPMGLQASADFILDNMSGRIADQLRDELTQMETPEENAAEAAMTEIIGTIRDMESLGELVMISTED